MASRDPATASADHTAAASRLGRAVIVAVFAAVLLHWLVGPIAGVAVWSWPVLQRQRASARRQEQILGELPEVIDLFRLAAASGLNVRLSVAAVARRAPEVVGASLARAVDQLVLGGRLSSLLTQMAVEIGEPIRPLVAALLDSERYGTPLSDALDRLAIEARLQRRHRAEEVARRLPVKLLFPLVLLVLPAFVVLTFYVAVHTACYFALQRFQPQLAVLAGGHNRDDRQVGGAEASRRLRGDRGQTTAEYALVLLGAAGIAVLFAAWAAKSGKIGKLLDAVIDQVIDKAK